MQDCDVTENFCVEDEVNSWSVIDKFANGEYNKVKNSSILISRKGAIKQIDVKYFKPGKNIERAMWRSPQKKRNLTISRKFALKMFPNFFDIPSKIENNNKPKLCSRLLKSVGAPGTNPRNIKAATSQCVIKSGFPEREKDNAKQDKNLNYCQSSRINEVTMRKVSKT
jgi:hypothetical protein